MSNKHPREGFFGKRGMTIEVRDNNVDGAISALKRRNLQEGLLSDVRKREYYVSPGERRRQEKAQGIARTKKRARLAEQALWG